MAFWQYSFWAIPRDSLVRQYGCIPEEITEDDFNDLNWFDGFNGIGDFIKEINYLQPNDHWDKETVFFGEYDKDCISIMFDDKRLCEIKFRVDLRNDKLLILNKMIDSLSKNNFLILNENMMVFEPNIRCLIGDINADIKYKNNFFKNI